MKWLAILGAAIAALGCPSAHAQDVGALANSIYRDYNVPGNAVSGAYNPPKADVRSLWATQHGLNYNIAGTRLAAGTIAANSTYLGLGPLSLLGATLPLPTPSVLGGVHSIGCSTNQFVNGIDTTTGTPACATPTTGSSTTAAGSSGQFQTNSSGSLAGVTISGDVRINGTTGIATLANNLNVVAYGADKTGVADSCTGVNAAIAAIPALGGVVYFPAGAYTLACQIAVTNKPVWFVGDGSGVTYLNFTSATANQAGFAISENQPGYGIKFSGLNITTAVNQTTGNAGIKIARPSNSQATTLLGPAFDDLLIQGTGSTYWADGITCSWCTFMSARRVQIVGAATVGATAGTNMSRGIFLDNSTDDDVYDIHIYFANKGISLANDSEGLKLKDSSLVMVDWGVYTESSWTGPSLVVSNTHINATTGGVHITGGPAAGQTSQGQIQDNVIYRWTNATANPWVGIECINGSTFGCNDENFHDNNMISFKGGGPTGIAYCYRLGSNTTNVFIHDNICRDTDYFIDMGSSTSSTITIMGNHGMATGGGTNTGWMANPNPSSIWRNNNPVLFGTSDVVSSGVGLNASAWNIGGQPQTTIRTNATTPTTVTDGIGGWPGLVVTIQCSDTSTTIGNGSGNTKFALSGAANYTCPRIGATISFMYSDQWREIGRAG